MKQFFCSRWRSVRLASLFYENTVKNEDFLLSNALQFRYGSIVQKKKFDLTSDLIETYKKYTLIQPGDIMINGLNLNYDFITQRVALVPSTGIITSAYICLRPRNSVNYRFYTYYLKALDALKVFNGLGTGIRLTLSYDSIKNMVLPLPPREEQDQIVRYLDWQVSKINRLIVAKRKEIERIQEHLDKSIEIMFDEIASSSNDSIPLGRHITSIESGTSVNSIMGTADNDSIGVLSTSCVYGNNFDLSQNKRVAPSDYGRVSCPVKKNTLIISRMNAPSLVGACGFSEKDDTRVYLPDRLWQVRFDNVLMPEYAWRYLSTKRIKSWFATIATGTSSSMKNITKPQLKSIQIPFPSLEKQAETVRRIKTLCDKCNAACHVFEESIMHLIDLRTRLISDAVTGQIDVRGIKVPDDEYINNEITEEEFEEESENNEEE
mgnify:CR=1 FL=1